MEVSNNVTPLQPHDFNTTSNSAPFDANMTGDMDIDMDIDLSIDPEVAALEAEAMRIVRSLFRSNSQSFERP